MNTLRHQVPLLALALLLASCSSQATKEANRTPPPVVAAPAPEPASGDTFIYAQQPVSGRAPLVSEEQARAIIERFKAAYPGLGSPRMAICVNRRLIDEQSGLKLVGHSEQTQTTNRSRTEGDTTTRSTKEKVTGDNRYANAPKPEAPLADRQTVRDIERLFGRPFRFAGVPLADQDLAGQLLEIGSLQSLSLDSAQAVRDREAIMKIADVVVEILVSSKEVRVTELDGDKLYSVPDIQVTALRLKDARIMGQASSSDVYGGSPSPTLARSYTPPEITEATALALMEDMLTGIPPK